MKNDSVDRMRPAGCKPLTGHLKLFLKMLKPSARTEVRCLGVGRVLERFVVLNEEIAQFSENDKKFPRAEHENWNSDRYFSCEVAGHLNEFNLQLQGKKSSFWNYCRSKGFQNESGLFFFFSSQCAGSEVKPLTLDRGCDSVLLGQSNRTPHGAVIDEYGAMVE
jgi:hypothetical protein